MKMFAMRLLVAVAALWLCRAAEMELEAGAELEVDEEDSTGGKSEKKEAFTQKECLSVVKKVQKNQRYTEESIVPVCNDVMGRSSNCEFFAEALSLASSHSDFKGEHFCEDMDRAQFCSEIMDKLLQSTSVSDLAFGECERAKPQKSMEYCRRIQKMLGLSVKQEDLDTMRACYMMEAYTNQTGAKENEANKTSETSPQNSRIISSGNKELDTAGKGGGPGHPPKVSNIGRADIVVQPVPLASFGEGKGNITKPKGIIAEPAAAPGAAPAAGGEPTAKAPAPAGPILAEPIPAPPQEKSQLQKSSSSKASVLRAKPATLQQTGAHAATVSPALISQPLVAQAIMQNGTLVMTGTPFGTVKVDGSAIVEALRKQSATSGQVLTIRQPALVKPAPAPKQAAVPKQVAPSKTTPAQPTKAKVGLVVAEPPRVIKAVVPVAHPAAPVAQPVPKPQPPSAVLAQQVIKIVFVSEQPAAPPPTAPPAAKVKVAQAPVAPPAAKVKVAQAPVAPVVVQASPPQPATQATLQVVLQAPVQQVVHAPVAVATVQPAAKAVVAAKPSLKQAPQKAPPTLKKEKKEMYAGFLSKFVAYR